MAHIAVIYGSTTGNTAEAAKLIQKELGADLYDVSESDAQKLSSYRHLVLGTSTWGCGEIQDDWYARKSILSRIDLKGKTVALFGMGDQLSYTETYLNGMGELYQEVSALGAIVVGFWPTEGYEFSQSSAIREDHFVGLALDQDNQSESTRARIEKWCSELKKTFG